MLQLSFSLLFFLFFFFNDTATTEIYTLSLHDALPILAWTPWLPVMGCCSARSRVDRKSTRLNSSHGSISYAVFCLKKKKQMNIMAIFSHEFTNVARCARCVVRL